MKNKKLIIAMAAFLLIAVATLASAKPLVMGRDPGGIPYWYDSDTTPGIPAVLTFGILEHRTVGYFTLRGNPQFRGTVGTKVVDKFGNVAYGAGLDLNPARFKA